MSLRHLIPLTMAALISLAPGCPPSNGTPTGTGKLPCLTENPCPASAFPQTIHLTVSGFVNCSCFNGTFTLTQQSSTLWASDPITGCPGQNAPSYLKFSSDHEFGIGITDKTSSPGSGDSNFSCATAAACSPLAVSGQASRAGNITGDCSSASEDLKMSWSLAP